MEVVIGVKVVESLGEKRFAIAAVARGKHLILVDVFLQGNQYIIVMLV